MTKEGLKSKEVSKEALLDTFNSLNNGLYVSATKLTQQLKMVGIITKRKRVTGSDDKHCYSWV